MSSKTTFRHRCLTISLLVLLGGDIASHVLAGLYSAPDDRAGVTISDQEGPGQFPAEDHSGCGNPEHWGLPGHHHHFPAILRPVHLPIKLAVRLQPVRAPDATTPHVLLVARSVRAPPSRLSGFLHSALPF